MGQDGSHGRRDFARERLDVLVDARSEGVVAMGEHGLSEVVGGEGRLDPKIAQHGVGLPAAQELDGVRIDVGAKEGRGAARAQGAGRDCLRRDAGNILHGSGSVLKGVLDVFGGDAPDLAGGAVIELVERAVRLGA